MTHRRAFAGLLLLGLVGCKRAERCSTCGMRIEAQSHWESYLVVDGKQVPFDTPRCAFTGWRGPFSRASDGQFREYYSQQIRPSGSLRFIYGSDVIGPMGPDLVPVDAAQAAQFARDHNGAPPMTAEQIRTEGIP